MNEGVIGFPLTSNPNQVGRPASRCSRLGPMMCLPSWTGLLPTQQRPLLDRSEHDMVQNTKASETLVKAEAELTGPRRCSSLMSSLTCTPVYNVCRLCSRRLPSRPRPFEVKLFITLSIHTQFIYLFNVKVRTSSRGHPCQCLFLAGGHSTRKVNTHRSLNSTMSPGVPRI